MPFSLLVLDASEPRQTGMDIWRESGDRLAVLTPAPQKHSYTHSLTHIHLHAHTYQHISVVQSCEPSLLPAVWLSQNLFHTSIVGILEPPWFPIIPLGQWQGSRMKAGLLSVLANAHPPRGRKGWQIKAKVASTKLCLKNSPAWIASLPHIFVSVSSASHRCVSAHCVYVVWCLVPTAGPQILSKGHRLSSVRNSEVLLGGQTDNETTCSLHFYYTCIQMQNESLSLVGPIPTGFCCFIQWWCHYWNEVMFFLFVTVIMENIHINKS